MPTRKFSAALAFVLILSAPALRAGATPVESGPEPEYYLTLSPLLPTPGTPVTVSLEGNPGMAPVEGARWNLSGAPATNAGGVPGDPRRFSFTPTVPGTYTVTAEFYDYRRYRNISSLEIVISGAVPTPAPALGRPVPSGQLYISASPKNPRVGQPAVFTLHLPGGIPAGGEVRWEVSGGPALNLTASGGQQQTCSFSPGVQTTYHVKAAVVDAQGYLTAEVSVGFVPVQ